MSSPNTYQFYQQLKDRFEQDYRLAGVEDLTLLIGEHLARLRFTSSLLREHFRRPLAFQEVPDAGQQADFTLDMLDGGSSATLELPWAAQRTSVEQATAEFQEGPYLFTQHSDLMLTAVNYQENHTVGVVRDPTDWPLQHYKQSIFITLYQHLRLHHLYLVHASAIGLDGRVLLIAGHSGAGKTTTMLTSVRSGFDFLGDDTTLVRRSTSGQAEVISLLSTLNVTDKTVSWFPELGPHLSAKRNHKGKRQVLMSEVYPDRMARAGQVAMILVPEVNDREETVLAPAKKVALLSDLLLNSLDLHEAAAAKSHLDFLAELLETLPSYRILLGRDRDRLPTLLAGLLEEGVPQLA